LKIKLLLAVFLVLVITITGGLYGCTPKLNGDLPHFTIGDKWVAHWHTGGVDYTVTTEVTGSALVSSQECWVMETTFDPAYAGTVTGMTNKYDKNDLDIIFSEYHMVNPNDLARFEYKISGTDYYPLTVGKEAQEISFQSVSSGNTTIYSTENSTVTTNTKVEKIEKITVPAGTFECFKVLKYDEQGNLIQITWRSDKIKLFQVKMTDPTEPDALYELVSFYSPDKTSK
jgi:hypothetical protein